MSDSTALVIAHPGHELRAFAFLRRRRPMTAVLTDGSGSRGVSRIAQTRQILRENGCEEGCWMGETRDADIYRMILTGEVAPFVRWTRRLAMMLKVNSVTFVAGDALEGFNPTHDLCRFMLDFAVELVAQETGIWIENREFLLEGPPGICPSGGDEDAVTMDLKDEEFAAKKITAQGYAELRTEMERALAKFGEAPFRREIYLRAGWRGPPEKVFATPPYYETFGELRVQEGVFRDLIRYREHVRPLVGKLRSTLGLPDL